MLPILELLEKVHRMRYVHFTCNTLGEFRWNLERFKARTNFRVLYLAGHGTTNEMELANGDRIDLETLSDIMGNRFAGWTVHLGGCGTINGSNADVRSFMQRTDVAMVTGYSKEVDWMSSAALDMLWFSSLQSGDNFSDIWENFRRDYIGLVRSNGMRAVFNR